MTQKCTRCKKEKEYDDFHRRSKSKTGRASICKECRRVIDRQSYLNPERKKYIRDKNVEYRKRNQAWLADYLENHPCVDCGQKDIRTLHFDHKDPMIKIDTISNLLKSSFPAMKKEIEKCDVRCANCHAIRTSEQFGWYKQASLVSLDST